MRLSVAFMLGIHTCKLRPLKMNSCAFGAALNAEGVPQAKWFKFKSRYEEVRRLWPWTQGKWGMIREAAAIYEKFDTEVCFGKMTLEQLHDYIKSVEPDCDCNRFNCNCVQKRAAAEIEKESVLV